MGHSVDAFQYRLSFRCNWRGGFPADSSPSAAVLVPLLDAYLSRFLAPFGRLLYSHVTLLRRGSTLRLLVFVHLDFPGLLVRFLRRRFRRRLASPFLRSFHRRRKVVSLAALRRSRLVNLGNHAFRFPARRWRAGLARLCQCHLATSRLGHQWPSLVDNRLPFPTVAVVASPFRLPTAALIARTLVRRLRTGRYRLRRLIQSFTGYNFSRYSKRGLLGVAIASAGRFSRTQRASALTLARGTVPRSTVAAVVDSAAATVYLKYGACTVRVWLHRRP